MHPKLAGLVLAASDLTIDWDGLPLYNTIMAVAAGSGLLVLVMLGRQLGRDPRRVDPFGYALGLGVPGLILVATGLHMTLTWPLAPEYPFDNIIFGETSLGFGVLLFAGAFYAWRRGPIVLEAADPIDRLCDTARPISVFIAGLGLGLIAIGAAGMRYRLFAAPPQEPISGWYFSAYPWVEATFISGIWALVGLGAIAFTLGVTLSRRWLAVSGWAWLLSGLALVGFGALNFFTHIGLIVETM